VWRRRHVDPAAVRAGVAGRCFICEIVAGNPDFAHHVFYEDEHAVAFLNAYPTLYAQSIVAPREHREQVTGDFALNQYLELQTVVHGVGEALRRVVPTERLYVASLGSQQANRHVHWHVAPLPPGMPFERQQLAALAWETEGVLDVPDVELAALATGLRARLAADEGQSLDRGTDP
jgi:diadenosine tetraphosphate (Ap4A) HIT family hydrolase